MRKHKIVMINLDIGVLFFWQVVASGELIVYPLKFIMFSLSSLLEVLSSLSLDDTILFSSLSSSLAFLAMSYFAKSESLLSSSFSFFCSYLSNDFSILV